MDDAPHSPKPLTLIHEQMVELSEMERGPCQCLGKMRPEGPSRCQGQFLSCLLMTCQGSRLSPSYEASLSVLKGIGLQTWVNKKTRESQEPRLRRQGEAVNAEVRVQQKAAPSVGNRLRSPRSCGQAKPTAKPSRQKQLRLSVSSTECPEGVKSFCRTEQNICTCAILENLHSCLKT